jgi:putative ATP-dependent endonuclease of OLD family
MIERVKIKNYRALKSTDIHLNEHINVIVGDNEAGKSTLLEAINLALRCQINRRPAPYELHPFLFNVESVAEFIACHKAGKPTESPEVLIELFLKDVPATAELRGSINSERVDAPGISLAIRLDENFAEEYGTYVADADALNTIPIEYYAVVWQSFAGEILTHRAIPIKSTLIDPSAISNTYAANKYVLEIVRDYLTKAQAVDLALSYRHMRDEFQSDERIQAINEDLAGKTGIVSEKTLSVAMDTTTRASWETGVLPHLDDIPLTLVGKGEQNGVKIKLAIEAAEACDIFLMEEPENHLSHSNLNKLIKHIADRCSGKQLILSTHSSFVLNKLGVDHVLMFDGKTGVSLNELPSDTKAYFMKLPGYDTLRMILASQTILVEGPSDELIVQKAFKQTHGVLPLEAGVEVISVGTSFKRFLDIAMLMNLNVSVVRDNDGDAEGKIALFDAYKNAPGIQICIDKDNDCYTLEPQLVKANGVEKLNSMLDIKFKTADELIAHMIANKTDCALMLFEHGDDLAIPEYIGNAVG